MRVAVTGASGQIGYALLFRVASGQMLGPDEKIGLRLLEIPDAVKAAEGTALELQDCAFPLLASTEIFDDPKKAFDGVNVALLVGARPRSKGMERSTLLEANGSDVEAAGRGVRPGAVDDVRMLVVGDPPPRCPDHDGPTHRRAARRSPAMTRLRRESRGRPARQKVGWGCGTCRTWWCGATARHHVRPVSHRR